MTARRTSGGLGPSSGMTLIELLVAMALLASLGGFIVQLMRNSFDLYAAGERRGEYASIGMVALDALDDDLRNVVTSAGGRLVLEGRGVGSGVTAPLLMLRLVRTPPGGEQGHPVLRRSGGKSPATGQFTGADPGPGERDAVAPGGGLMEVCWALIQDPNEDAGVFTLYRGVHAPAFEGATFFGADDEVERDAAWVRRTLAPVTGGVLLCKILCWGPETTDWDEETVLEGRGAASTAWEMWDSTRGILGPESFAYAKGARSTADPRDDVFPRTVRLLLTLTRPGRPDAKLSRRFKGGDTDLYVDNSDRLPRPGGVSDEDRYVKVGGEWLRIMDVSAGAATVGRGTRRSAVVADMPTGSPVFAGRTFRLTTPLPPAGPVHGAVTR